MHSHNSFFRLFDNHLSFIISKKNLKNLKVCDLYAHICLILKNIWHNPPASPWVYVSHIQPAHLPNQFFSLAWAQPTRHNTSANCVSQGLTLDVILYSVHLGSYMRHLGSYMRALLVSQERRHLFVTPAGLGLRVSKSLCNNNVLKMQYLWQQSKLMWERWRQGCIRMCVLCTAAWKGWASRKPHG